MRIIIFIIIDTIECKGTQRLSVTIRLCRSCGDWKANETLCSVDSQLLTIWSSWWCGLTTQSLTSSLQVPPPSTNRPFSSLSSLQTPSLLRILNLPFIPHCYFFFFFSSRPPSTTKPTSLPFFITSTLIFQSMRIV